MTPSGAWRSHDAARSAAWRPGAPRRRRANSAWLTPRFVESQPRSARFKLHKPQGREPIDGLAPSIRGARRLSTSTRRRHYSGTGRTCGCSQDAIDRRVKSGHWLRCSAASTSSTTGRSPTRHESVRVYGATAPRRGQWASGRVVARPHTVRTRNRRSYCAPRCPPATKPAIATEPARPRHRLDIVQRNGLRVTALPLTVIEAAAGAAAAPG